MSWVHELGLWFHSMTFLASVKPTRFSLISHNNDSTDIYQDIFSSSTMSTNDSTRAISSRSNGQHRWYRWSYRAPSVDGRRSKPGRRQGRLAPSRRVPGLLGRRTDCSLQAGSVRTGESKTVGWELRLGLHHAVRLRCQCVL